MILDVRQPDMLGGAMPRMPVRGRPLEFFCGTIRPCTGKLRNWAADHLGYVYRRDRNGRWRMQEQVISDQGYFVVPLTKGRPVMVHQIVAAAFLGDPPPGHEVRHGPMGQAVNEPSNLSWGTRSDNQLDRHRDGTMGHAKLTANDVVIALHCFANGESFALIGRRLGVSRTTVRSIIAGRTWSHVPCAAPRHPELLERRRKRRRAKASQPAKRRDTKATATTTH